MLISIWLASHVSRMKTMPGRRRRSSCPAAMMEWRRSCVVCTRAQTTRSGRSQAALYTEQSAAAGRCRLPVTPCHSIARRRLSPPMGDLDCHAREPSSRSWEDLSDRRRRRWMDGPLVASWCRVTLSSMATTTGVATASAHLILHSFLRIAYTDRLAW